MSYDPAIVANAVLYEARRRWVLVDHMKLQKLVFLVHAWGLAINDSPVCDEQPQAWTYGLAFDSLFHKLKNFGLRTIQGYVSTMNPATGRFEALVPHVQDLMFWKLLRQVMDRYGRLSAVKLATLTCEPGGPWSLAREAQVVKIEHDVVKAHYRAQLRSAATPS